MSEPKSGDLGAIVNGLFTPLSVPPSYIPAKGETGLAVTSETGGKVFLPIEPIYRTGLKDEFPFLEFDQEIDREPPFYDQVDMRVATPCVAPYNWTAATADRTLILDTTPDASASAEEKALPGYVANPGLTLSSRTHADFDPTKYDDDDGIGYLWTYATTGSTPATPHPDLRAGQTRYAGISGSAVGTAFDGTPFLPSPLTNGTLKVSAYKHGLLLSDVPSWTVKVKIGRGKATWSKAAQTLTIETTQTTGTTIKYTLNGGSPTTYSGPISITDTATVVWYAEKTNLVTSDSWSTYIEYQDEAPPDDFETIYFSSLPAFSNSPVKTVVQFQQRPDFYISPSGTGDGLTPSTPSNATTVIGLTTATGLAVGSRGITSSKSGTADMTLARTGANPSGSVMKYSLDNSIWTTYSAPFAQTAPGRVWFKLERSGGAALSPVWMRPWFIGTGTGVQINAVWSLSAQTLTLTYEPTPLVASDVTVLYSLDGSTPSLVYSGPISITSDCTPKVKAIHPVDTGTPSDFATSTGVYTCTTIDIDATADYDEDHAATWTTDATVAAYTFSRGGDLVWACEGTYTNPTGTATTYFSNSEEIIVRGGFSSDFTERDVMNRKTIFESVVWNASPGLTAATNDHVLKLSNITNSVIDGCWGESEIAYTTTNTPDPQVPDMNVLVIPIPGWTTTAKKAITLSAKNLYNCHVYETISIPSAMGGSGGTRTIDSFLGAFTWTWTGTKRAHELISGSFVFLQGVCSACSSNISVGIANAYPGTDGPDGSCLHQGYAFGGNGGAVSLSISVGSSGGLYNAFTTAVMCGDGGDGGDAGSMTATYHVEAFGGYGGSVSVTVQHSGVDLGVSDITITCGNGGAGGSASGTYTTTSSGGSKAQGIGGSGGSTTAIVTIPSAKGDTKINASAIVGDGGKFGSTTKGNYLGGDFFGLSRTGGASSAQVSCALAYNTRKDTTLYAESGKGGDADYWWYLKYTGEEIQTWSSSGNTNSSIALGTIQGSTGVDSVVISGNGGSGAGAVSGSSIAYVSAALAYCFGMSFTGSATCGTGSSSRAYFINPVNPAYFLPGDVTFTEGAPYGAGNPVRVDHSTGSTVGWYHGLDNGNGAPAALAGGAYYGAQGTGVQLGRYWE